MDDFVTTLNTALPVSVGGTGVGSVSAAQTAFKIPPFDGSATISGAWTVSGAWTFTGDQTFNDNVKARFGTGNDLEIYHNGSNSFITDAGTGALVIGGSIVQIVGTASEILFRATAGGASELRHNNNTKAVTTTTGFTVTGLLSADTIGGAMVSTSISTDTGSTTKVPHVAAIEAYVKPLTITTKQASTSGTAIDFTGIPAGAKEVIVMFNGVSLSGSDNFLVQLGDAGGVETTGYDAVSNNNSGASTSTAGFVIRRGSATTVSSGQLVLTLMDAAGFGWASTHTTGGSGGAFASGAGYKALSAELTRVRITSTGTDTFDAGEINIAYR